MKKTTSIRPLALTTIICGLFASLNGCQSFRARQREAGITEARQFSLRGADALQSSKFDDAEALFSEALRRCPTDERAHWGMAEIQAKKGDCHSAAVHMQEASRLSGNNPDMLVRLGEMHLEAGQTDQAVQQAQAALNSNRNHWGAWQLQGKIYQQQQLWQQALDCYHRALMSKPNNPTAQMAAADIYLRLGRPQRALATLERMSDLQSAECQLATVHLLRGIALASLGQTEEAKLCLREATQRAAPEEIDLFLQIAQAQSNLGQIAEARISLGHLLSLQPTNAEALALQFRLDQQFATLVSTEMTIPTIDAVGASAIVPQNNFETAVESGTPARRSIYQIPRDK